MLITFDAYPGQQALVARGGGQLQEGEQGQPGGHTALEGFGRWGEEACSLLGLSKGHTPGYRLQLTLNTLNTYIQKTATHNTLNKIHSINTQNKYDTFQEFNSIKEAFQPLVLLS